MPNHRVVFYCPYLYDYVLDFFVVVLVKSRREVAKNIVASWVGAGRWSVGWNMQLELDNYFQWLHCHLQAYFSFQSFVVAFELVDVDHLFSKIFLRLKIWKQNNYSKLFQIRINFITDFHTFLKNIIPPTITEIQNTHDKTIRTM